MEDVDVSASTSVSYPIEQDKSPEQALIEQAQEREDYALAALKDHPGWKQIYDRMKADVDRIRSLAEVDMKQYTDKELGEVVRGEFRMASKLEEYLTSVEQAVQSVINGKSGA